MSVCLCGSSAEDDVIFVSCAEVAYRCVHSHTQAACRKKTNTHVTCARHSHSLRPRLCNWQRGSTRPSVFCQFISFSISSCAFLRNECTLLLRSPLHRPRLILLPRNYGLLFSSAAHEGRHYTETSSLPFSRSVFFVGEYLSTVRRSLAKVTFSENPV